MRLYDPVICTDLLFRGKDFVTAPSRLLVKQRQTHESVSSGMVNGLDILSAVYEIVGALDVNVINHIQHKPRKKNDKKKSFSRMSRTSPPCFYAERKFVCFPCGDCWDVKTLRFDGCDWKDRLQSKVDFKASCLEVCLLSFNQSQLELGVPK